ncbi:ATP-binding protein [Marinibactrum halimedae]|uniref:AAA+ ATPase domain-containing protein n=1 Tax=Marinibactrum halimedae TaxID=1444977 RepID=A0AA37T5R5_9GAMM|nr:ATP-binding protein [Marinibactrum halimedae]MCD9460617.1 ATP-binding protein [Marinibactrum halimedae]GLS27833.1 hypothetical protein GCM10007877_35520 [Marinibactrum halimedae]
MIPLWQGLAAMVRLGLIHFWRQALPNNEGLLPLLQQEAEALLETPELKSLDAKALFGRLDKHVHHAQQETDDSADFSHDPLFALISDYDLSLNDALLLALLGEAERSHVVTLAIHQLQSPTSATHPMGHLIESWLQSLTSSSHTDFSVLSGLQHPLVTHGFVRVFGNGPAPLKQWATSPECWAVLTQSLPLWPGTTQLEPLQSERKLGLDLLPHKVQNQLAAMVERFQQPGTSALVLRGLPLSGRRLLTLAIADRLGLNAIAVDDTHWQENALIRHIAPYGDWLPVLTPAIGPGETYRPVLPDAFCKTPRKLIIHMGTDGAIECPGAMEWTLPLPNRPQRQTLWEHFLGDTQLAERASMALLSGPSIQVLAQRAQSLAAQQSEPVHHRHLVHARLQHGAEQLKRLAQPDTRAIPRDAIVLPPLVESELEQLVARTEQRESLWPGLGATLTQTQTTGVRALFVGESGTGKTLAANFIATRLGSPLYRVDLASVMNKYIGESEKNLSAVLDRAAANDVVLLFDEADSLFGRRTDGKETGERFANMLTHFLLTRLEHHPGIVVLTSNNRERIDAAFTRRLDFIIEFPLPGFEARQQLWQSHLGQRGPGEEVYALLASYCDFTGGQLRNVVLTAATCAENGPITTDHLLTGLQAEYRKLGRNLPNKLLQIKYLKEQNNVISQTLIDEQADE